MGLTGKHIFILGATRFDGLYESTSFTIAKHLSQDNHVYYIDYPFTWKDYSGLKNTEQFKVRKPYFSFRSDGLMPTDMPGLKIIITPPVASINFLPEGRLYRILLNINEKLIINRIKKVIRKNKIKQFIYINSFNFHYPDISRYLAPELTVYHCVDPLIIPYDKKHGLISEAQLVKESDLVICTSRQLYEEKQQQNNNTFFVPNAADISHSSKALDASLPVHASIAGIKKPVIGYFGNIERRMDYTLLKEVITRNPDKNFVFAGPVAAEFVPEWFYNIPNVFFTGRLPYNEMPALIKGFDVALIPFKKDEVSRTIFPLKLFEYLGAGKPVITTDFNPDLEEFTGNTVSFCNDAVSFSDAITAALNNNTPAALQERLTVAQNNTWEKRSAEFAGLIAAHLRPERLSR